MRPRVSSSSGDGDVYNASDLREWSRTDVRHLYWFTLVPGEGLPFDFSALEAALPEGTAFAVRVLPVEWVSCPVGSLSCGDGCRVRHYIILAFSSPVTTRDVKSWLEACLGAAAMDRGGFVESSTPLSRHLSDVEAAELARPAWHGSALCRSVCHGSVDAVFAVLERAGVWQPLSVELEQLRFWEVFHRVRAERE
jgi:hypothetical protein